MKEMTTDEIKMCSLAILDFIDQVCKENHLRYFLCGGTLLGAIRHKGFIPWDDDIDVMMPRKDYERLFKVWPHNSYYEALNYKNTHNFPYAYGKAIDKRTVKFEPIRNDCQTIGVDVDIFPIDSIPEDEKTTIVFFEDIKKYQKRLNKQVYPIGKSRNIFRTVARFIIIILRRMPELIGINTIDGIVRSFSNFAQRYNNTDSSFCGITAISHYGEKEKNPKTSYETTVNVEFEGKNYPSPSGYDLYLSQLYSKNYMQLPPLEQRKTHHTYKAYWK